MGKGEELHSIEEGHLIGDPIR